MRTSRVSLLAFVLLLPACTKSTVATQAPPDATEALKELGELYKYRAAEQLPPPTKLSDLAEHRAVLDNAWPLIESGVIVVQWKVGYATNSTAVLAYAKDTPSSGGTVLLRNGTVKQVSAGEFKVAQR